jgi:hypothetical protein
MADRFARRADGNAFADDRVVISKVEKSVCQNVVKKMADRLWSKGLCSGRI